MIASHAVTRSLAVAVTLSVAPIASAQTLDDGVYGRFLGDLELGIGLGAEIDSPVRGALRASAVRYRARRR